MELDREEVEKLKANVVSILLVAGDLAYDIRNEWHTRRYARALVDELLRVAAKHHFRSCELLRAQFVAGEFSSLTMRLAINAMRLVPLDVQRTALDRAVARAGGA